MRPQDMSGACWSCVHWRPIDGSAHVQCAHPDATASFLAHAAELDENDVLKVVGDPQGVKSGWFNWPFSFDPTWLQCCEGFEAPIEPNPSHEEPS